MYIRVDVPTVAAALAAILVAVDGKIDDREKRVATGLGQRMLPGFAPFVFDTLLDGVEHVPPAEGLAAQISELLDDKGKREVMEYLVAIAQADEVVVEVERQQLEAIAGAFGIEVPELNVEEQA